MTSFEVSSLRNGRACPGHPRADWNSPDCSAQRFFPHPASLEEMKRVLARGGVLMVAVAGFIRPAEGARLKVIGPNGNPLPGAAATYGVHGRRDYWRFSPQATRQIILDGFDINEMRPFMAPPRLIGIAVKSGVTGWR
jgi:hypothetical protein